MELKYHRDGTATIHASAAEAEVICLATQAHCMSEAEGLVDDSTGHVESRLKALRRIIRGCTDGLDKMALEDGDFRLTEKGYKNWRGLDEARITQILADRVK